MPNVIKTHLVKIGNSQGVRIPKPLLEQVGLSGEVQIEVDNDRLILSSAAGSRQGWEKQFQKMALQGDDRLVDGADLLLTSWEEKEWDW